MYVDLLKFLNKSKIEDYFADFARYRTPPDGKVDKNFLCLFPRAKTVILLNCKHFPLFIIGHVNCYLLVSIE